VNDKIVVDANGMKHIVQDARSNQALRDQFAMAALPVIAPGHERDGETYIGEEEYDHLAYDAYLLADAMLKAREK
jgi:hypothetical protein